jgi:hypothetical protein
LGFFKENWVGNSRERKHKIEIFIYDLYAIGNRFGGLSMKSYIFRHIETDADVRILAGSEKSALNVLVNVVKRKKDWNLAGEHTLGKSKSNIKRA